MGPLSLFLSKKAFSPETLAPRTVCLSRVERVQSGTQLLNLHSAALEHLQGPGWWILSDWICVFVNQEDVQIRNLVKKRCKSAEPHVFPPLSSEATLRARLFLGQEGDAATRGEARRSRGIQDVCVMLFDTWADSLCQTWRGALFTVTVPWNGSSRKSSGRKKQREGMNSSLIPEMSVWRGCSTSINLFFISPRRSQEGGPFGHAWLVKCSTVGKAALCFCLLFVFSWGT